MRLAGAAEVATLDRLAAAEHGLPTAALMENAGARVAEAAAALLGSVAGRRILVVCGRGNNGGDGLVAARILARAGARVRVVLAGMPGQLRPEPANALAAAAAAGVPILPAPDAGALRALGATAPADDLVIDAILGTGFTPPARDLAAEAIALVAARGAPVLAVDLPSGLSADDGVVAGPVVSATATVTLALPKPGLLLHPGTRHVGRLWVGDIGLPAALLAGVPLSRNLATATDLAPLLAPRDPEAHKGTFGHVLVVGGSAGMIGAVALVARGALRAGAGLVTAALPRALADPTLPGLPEAMVLPLPDRDGAVDGATAAAAVSAALAGKRSLALGPGLSRQPGAAALVRALLPGLAVPTVLDADGINALAGNPEVLREAGAALVLTPHPGELARLLGLQPAAVSERRVDAALACAARSGAVVVLKGARTIVADPSGETWINATGNPALAAAGMGDVLTGVIAAHLARGLAPLRAAVLGVHLHGLAGDLAAAALGPFGVLAGEVADRVPPAARELTRRAADAAPAAGGLSLVLP